MRYTDTNISDLQDSLHTFFDIESKIRDNEKRLAEINIELAQIEREMSHAFRAM